MSPGQTIDYIVGYSNDGLLPATEAVLYSYIDPVAEYISASKDAYYSPYGYVVSWSLGAVPAKSEEGYLSIKVKFPWGLPVGFQRENRAYIFDLILHSTFENGFINGMCFDSLSEAQQRLYRWFYEINNATWFPLYDRTNYVTGALETYLASRGVRTSRNGVGDNNSPPPGPLVYGYRPEWIAYSAGTATAVNQAKQGRLSGDTLYLISPQLVTQEDLQAIKAKFGKIVVYQGDDLIPNGVFYNFAYLSKEQAIEYFKKLTPPDDQIESLLKALEDNKGETLRDIKLLRNMPGNLIELTWTDGSTTDFTITSPINPEDGIEVINIPGIKHEEWIPLLGTFKERYKRLPSVGDVEILKDILKEIREKAAEVNQSVVVGRDPNELIVSPEGNIKPGDKLSYTINYENEGEGNAYGVYITDKLLANLDDTTLAVNSGGKYDSATRTITWFIGELSSKQKGSVKIGRMVTKIQKIVTKTGKPMMFSWLEDLTSKIEVVVFPNILEKHPDVFQENSVLVIKGTINERDGIPKLLCDEVRSIAMVA